MLVSAVAQVKLFRQPLTGVAHFGIFLGFLAFLPRIVVLLGRAFDAEFCAFDGSDRSSAQLWMTYDWLKNAMAVVVLCGTLVFATLRLSRGAPRLQPTFSAMWILGAIAMMMVADLLYDASGILLADAFGLRSLSQCPSRATGFCAAAKAFAAPFVGGSHARADAHVSLDPVISFVVSWLRPLRAEALVCVGLGSYGLHLALVGVFLVVLPHTKHFHLVTVWPNLLFNGSSPSGKLGHVAASTEGLLNLVERELGSTESGHCASSAIGRGSLCDFSVKDRLRLFACTQCGRCTMHCPAWTVGKSLDPRQLTVQLRGHLQSAPLARNELASHMAIPLVPEVVSPEALWACTNCGACEEQCPVGVDYVAPIVDMRRHLLLMRGEAPAELQRAYNALERQHNPYGFAHDERATWADGLGVRLLKDVDSVEFLYWVGCAASYDDRAKRVARSMARLMQRAHVSFAILGTEERCTGDMARRTGNELLYLQLAEHNIRLLNRYRADGRFQRIITACPHCLTTIGQQYPDLGGRYDVVSHVAAVQQWVSEGRLVLRREHDETITYQDPCNLARFAGVIDAPRHLLDALPGITRVEPNHHGREGFCCGAGGGQMWLNETARGGARDGAQGSESGSNRINERRVEELSRTGATRIVSACPFCLSMLGEGAKGADGTETPKVCDIAELVEQRCGGPT